MKTLKLHRQAEMGIRIITTCIKNFIIDNNGVVTIQSIEEYTGLHRISRNLVADLMRVMVKEESISINLSTPNGGTVTADIKKLRLSLEQPKTRLPVKHNKLWSEQDYITLAKHKMAGWSVDAIAKDMDRTASSVSMQSTLLKKAYRIIPIMERNKIVRDFASIAVSPNPAE